MDLIIQGIQGLFSNPINIMYFLAALFGGLFFGAVPGISVVTLGAIILPFTAYLDTSQALMIYGVILLGYVRRRRHGHPFQHPRCGGERPHGL